MRNPLFCLIVFLFISCHQKESDLIEIYLTNNRIDSYEGVPLRIAVKDSVILKHVLESWGENVRIDTIKNKTIFMGHFEAENKDLQKKPFIRDSEIMGLDFKNSKIHFTKSVSKRIYDSLPEWNKSKEFGKQFVLCHNGKIVMKGYLLNSWNKFPSSTYQIYYHRLPDKNDTIKEVSFSVDYGLNSAENNLKTNTDLYQAFNNRQINKK